MAAERLHALGLADRVEITRGDALRTGVADRWADAVLFRLALHHVLDTARAIRETARILTDGGRLLIEDGTRLPDADFAEMNARLAGAGLPPEPVPGFDPITLADLLMRQGFSVQQTREAGTMTFATPPFTDRDYAVTRFLLVARRGPRRITTIS